MSIGNINNFQIYSHERGSTTTSITFIFDSPTGNLGAFHLYRGYNPNVFENVKTRVDFDYVAYNPAYTEEYVSVTRLNNKVYFDYEIPATDDGRVLYFKMVAISKYNELSDDSSVVEFINYNTTVTSLVCSYDNYIVDLYWDPVDVSGDLNKTFKRYDVYRNGTVGIVDIFLTNNVLTSDHFEVGNIVWVLDVNTRSYWFGSVASDKSFELSDLNKISQMKKDIVTISSINTDDNTIRIDPATSYYYNYKKVTCSINNDYHAVQQDINKRANTLALFDVTGLSVGDTVYLTEPIYRINDTESASNVMLRNLRVYMESDVADYLGNTEETSFQDDTFFKDKYYIYKVYPMTTDGKDGFPVAYPVKTLSMLNAYPYLRSPANSDNEYIAQSYWSLMKNALVDKNYYKKDKFDIPYFHVKTTNLKGYLGLSRCKVDIYINDSINTTIETDDYGEFSLNYKLPKGTTKIQIHCRDKNNIDFSRKAAPKLINTLNVYSNFAVFGTEYQKVDDEQALMKTDVNIYTARYSTFVDKYNPFVELYKNIIETDDDFMDLAATVFNAYEYAGYEKGLTDIMDKFKELVPEIGDYEIHYKYSLYDTIRTRKSFPTVQPLLERGYYYYGVTAATYEGSETAVQVIRIDNRWWPFNYKGYNVLMWDATYGADFYKIYRGTSEDNLGLLQVVSNNIFIDNGSLTPDYDIVYPLYNYSGMLNVSNFSEYVATKLAQLELLYKKLANTIIFLFSNDDEEIPEIHLTRMEQLFEKMIPPEIRYTMFYIRDSVIYIYPDDITITPPVPPTEALYDINYYDSEEVYA